MARLAEKSLPRVIFIGDSGVGKTSIIIRVTTGVFDASPAPTIGAGVRPVTISVDDKPYKYHIWDTAGQEIYRSIVPLYFKQAVAAVVCFSLDDPKSFGNLGEWIDLLKEHSFHNVPVIICGNKTDLKEQQMEIPELKKWASQRNYPIFFTSAVTGEGIPMLFEHITRNYIATVNLPEEVIDKRVKTREDDEQKCC